MYGRTASKIVLTIHGIRTPGRWQKEITTHLAKHGLVPYHIDYGWFGALGFFVPFFREKKIAAVRKEVQTFISYLGTNTRVSVIAHSFGTLLAMEILIRDNGAIQYDRVVLTGSIIDRAFDWGSVLDDKRWVLAARNERATKDSVVSLAKFLSSAWCKWFTRLAAGDSGKHPFSQSHPCLFDDEQIGGHSQLHNPQKYEQWARFIAYPVLPEDLLMQLQVELESLRKEAASSFGIAEKHVRANLFAPIDGKLRLVPGAADNMLWVPELDLAIQPGNGSTGTAFETGKPCCTRLVSRRWESLRLLQAEQEKINPELRWVISCPIRSNFSNKILAVVNIDGLNRIPPALERLDPPDSNGSLAGEAAILYLSSIAQGRVATILDHAFNGTRLKGIEA